MGNDEWLIWEEIKYMYVEIEWSGQYGNNKYNFVSFMAVTLVPSPLEPRTFHQDPLWLYPVCQVHTDKDEKNYS